MWALLPPPAQNGQSDIHGRTVARDDEDARYVLQFAPGFAYMPGTCPFGIGEPLQGLSRVLRAFEARFPDTRVEVLTVPLAREYLVTQLSTGEAPDIVNVNVEDVWADVEKGWYVPLDPFLEAPNEHVREQGDPNAAGYNQWWDLFRYQTISRGKAAPDGRCYCISYDMVETAIYYNKNIFERLNLGVPASWDELLVSMERIRMAGIVPLLLTMNAFSDWGTDLIFDQLYYSILPGIDLHQDPVREQYLQGYLDDIEIAFLFSKGFFTQDDPRYRELWPLLRVLRQYCNKDLTSADPIREFVTQRGAMMWTDSSVTYRLSRDSNLGFDWGVFYLPQLSARTSHFASGQPMCVIGGASAQFSVTNSAVADTPQDMPFADRVESSERLKRVIQLLQFLTMPENYDQIVNEYPGFLPNIVGVPVQHLLRPFEEILSRRYTTTKWMFTFDLKFAEIHGRMLELYLNDGINLDEFLSWQVSNIHAATQSMLIRRNTDVENLQKAWDNLAPLRATMDGLPDDAQ